MSRSFHVAVVGATGAVGVEMLNTLENRNFPVGKLTPLASARSAGKKLKFRGEDVTVLKTPSPVLILPFSARVEVYPNNSHRSPPKPVAWS